MLIKSDYLKNLNYKKLQLQKKEIKKLLNYIDIHHKHA